MLIFLTMLAASPLAASSEPVAGRVEAAAWVGCVMAQASRLQQLTRETAATVADAALGQCAVQEAEFRAILARLHQPLGVNETQTDTLMTRSRQSLRERAIAGVIEARAKRR